MARYGQRPENALKRANEFIEVGKPARALDTLQEVFRNKKWTYNWSESVLEPIMFKYLDLCVELKKSHIAKEGLFQYRNMFQSVNVGSLENVIRGYLRMAEEKTDMARKQSQQAVVDIDDLDNLATPESILLSAVSGEDAQDRSDRTILTPWVKFLWESYCQCLELLRTNAHVETLYHDIARMAFQFCLEYNRKTEFRKLCEKLRKHLEDISKLPQMVSNVSINKIETQQMNLETRLHQLDSAIQMELWQEAYKAIEDIHGLMNLSKKMSVPKTMANYYQKLAMVFWKAGNYLFHAAALLKLFQLSREMKKNMSPEEQQKMANRVLLATLSIPLPSSHPEFDRFIETDKSPQEKAQKLAVLLGLSQPPTRISLLRDIVRLNVITFASPQLQNLYTWLEIDFHPLELCERVEKVIENLKQDDSSLLLQYVNALQDVTLVRLVHQISQVYQSIHYDRLLALAKFSTAFHLERLLVDCVRYNDMQIRIDHGKRSIHFGVDLSEAQREDHPDGPILQVMPSEQIRCQLINMATVLHRALHTINPNKKKISREEYRTGLVNYYHETKLKEHQRILGRHKIIEERKEYIEHMNFVREEEEARRQEEIARQQLLAEQKRLELEREERERKRQQSEIQLIKDRTLKEKMQQISQTSHGQKVLKKLDEDEIKKLDAEQIAAREAEELQKERKEMQQKLKSQEKKIDYLERAKRLEEIPLLEKLMEVKLEAARARWELQEKERIAHAIEERENAVATRERLARIQADNDVFLEKILKERKAAYLEKLQEFEVILNSERAQRLAKRKLERKIERKIQWNNERQENLEKKRMEEMRQRQEEERQRLEAERAKREEEEKERRMKEEAAEAERLAKLEKQAEITRRREMEIEKKLEEERVKNAESRPREVSSWRKKGEGRTMDNASSWRAARERERDEERENNPPMRNPPRDEGREVEREEKSSWRDRQPGGERERDRDRDRDRDGPRKFDKGHTNSPYERSWHDNRDRDSRDNRESRDSRDTRDSRDNRFRHGSGRGDRGDRDRGEREDRDRDGDRRGDRGPEKRGYYQDDSSRNLSNWRSRDAAAPPKPAPKEDPDTEAESFRKDQPAQQGDDNNSRDAEDKRGAPEDGAWFKVSNRR